MYIYIRGKAMRQKVRKQIYIEAEAFQLNEWLA
jgi:hypothetical protein